MEQPITLEQLAQEDEKAHNESKFKSFSQNLESSLKKFESASDWTDLAQHLTKLYKV